MFKKLLLASTLAAFSLASTACNTVKGLGQDIESVGRTGEDVIN